jgi:hypothetical protein
MEDFTIVDMLNGETNLSKPIEDLAFVEELFAFLFLRDGFGEVSALGKFHDDFEFVLFGDVDFDKFDDVGMVKVFEYLCFLDGLVSLLLGHVIDVHFLDDQKLIISFSLDEVGLAESTLTQ